MYVCVYARTHVYEEWLSLPMNGHPIITLIVNIDIYCVPFVYPYYWPWNTAIYN